MGELADSIEFVDDDFLSSEAGRTASLGRIKATRGDRTLEYEVCEVVRWRDGRVEEEWLLVDDQHAYDEFWS